MANVELLDNPRETSLPQEPELHLLLKDEILDDPLYNIAVNDELLLHNVDAREVRDGDVIEIIPSMAGG